MIPAPFDYHAPRTLEEAVALLQSHGAESGEAKVLSGGQSLLPLLKLRLGAAGHLVDIGRIPGLEYLKEEDGFLKIGGRTRESALERAKFHAGLGRNHCAHTARYDGCSLEGILGARGSASAPRIRW